MLKHSRHKSCVKGFFVFRCFQFPLIRDGIQSTQCGMDPKNISRKTTATQMLNSRFAAVLISFTFITLRNSAFAFGFGLVIEIRQPLNCTLAVVIASPCEWRDFYDDTYLKRNSRLSNQPQLPKIFFGSWLRLDGQCAVYRTPKKGKRFATHRGVLRNTPVHRTSGGWWWRYSAN